MEKLAERKIIALIVLLMLVASSLVSLTGNLPTVYNVKADDPVDDPNYDWTTCSNNSSAWHNTTYLNVTIESKYPRILWYDIQVYSGPDAKDLDGSPPEGSTDDSNWTSIRNNMTEVDNATWLRIVVNVSSDQGWGNIEYINITGWHDDWDSDLDSPTGDDYNASGNHGSNRNFYLSYQNTNDSGYDSDNESYDILWPKNRTELTKGDFESRSATDELKINTTETRNLTFQFKPGYQFRYAPGPASGWTDYSVKNINGYPWSNGADVVDYSMSSWEQIENLGSWNFNISVKNRGQCNNGSDFSDANGGFSTWALDEFGVYSYTEIVSAEHVELQGAPGETASTNSSDSYTSGSENVTIRTRSNGNYSLVVNISDLQHSAYSDTLDEDVRDALILEAENVSIRGCNLTEQTNFSNAGTNKFIALYGTCNNETGEPGDYEQHEVNGTCKWAGENGTDEMDDNYPNDYNETADAAEGLRAYNGLNNRSYYIEFSCKIPDSQWPGKYSTHVYYHLRTETQ